MKKLLMLCMTFALFLAACGNNQKANDKIKISTTVFPLTSFVEQIGGEHVEVKSIYPAGVDIHSYEPTQKDTMNIAKGDLFIYTSSELDLLAGKIDKVINDKDKTLQVAKDIKESNLLVNEHNHDHGDEHDHEDHAHETAHDPHVWLDPVLDEYFAKQIKDKLVEKDPNHKADYEKNYDMLVKDIKEIDKQLKKITKNPKRDTVYISHESIGYLAHRYKFKEVGVSGLNNEEPSQRQVVQIINEINNTKTPYILYEQNISSKITDVIKKQTNAKALKFHNMSVLKKDDEKSQPTYQSIMNKNIEALDKALNN